ncbi:MAG: class II aldolase/adducin family protein [Cryobacterium sp.]|nr:class II aldolase/adducin family protein [Cryobacterium sp.]
MDDDVQQQVRTAARAVAHAGLSDAFGHVSARASRSSLLITPAIPLGSMTDDHELLSLDLATEELPVDAPRETWMHLAVLRARADVQAVCRAQPRSVSAWASLHLPLPVLYGHAALLGAVGAYNDSRLVRDPAAAEGVVFALGSASAVILRGNGALTVGKSVAHAVAAMWVLERSAELALRAAGAAVPHELPEVEREWWHDRADELLPRVYRHLVDESIAR